MNKGLKSEAARLKIIDTAIAEFGTKGYALASTNEICLNCDISKGLLFYHFGSKQQLYKICVTKCMEEFHHYMQEHFIKGHSPIESLKTCCYLRKDFFLSHPYFHKIFCDVIYSHDTNPCLDSQDLIALYKEHTFNIISAILADASINQRMTREEGIQWAISLIEYIDMKIWHQFQSTITPEIMLEEQMRQYETLLEILFYGILDK